MFAIDRRWLLVARQVLDRYRSIPAARRRTTLQAAAQESNKMPDVANLILCDAHLMRFRCTRLTMPKSTTAPTNAIISPVSENS